MTISDGTGVKSVHFILNYDPSLLQIGTDPGDFTVPSGWAVQVNSNTIGQLNIVVYTTDDSELGAGPQTVVTLTDVTVKANSAYGAAELLSFSNLLLNEPTFAGVAHNRLPQLAIVPFTKPSIWAMPLATVQPKPATPTLLSVAPMRT